MLNVRMWWKIVTLILLYYNEDELSDDGFYASLDDMGIYDNVFGHFITSYICYFCVECMHLFFYL